MRAVEILRGGGIAIYPTETFYGLGGDPGNLGAIQRIFALKGRELAKPLPLIAVDIRSVLSVVSVWPESANRLAEVFWPGPLSLLLTARDGVSPLIHGHTGKLALRISPHPVASALAGALGGLIVSTSANFSGEPPGRSLDDLPETLKGAVDVVVAGGLLTGGLPSTLVDLTVHPPRLVRPGAVAWDAVQRILNG